MSVLAGIVAYVLNRNEVNQSLDGQLRQIALNVGDTDSPATARQGDGVTLDPEDVFVVTIWNSAGERHSSDTSFVAAQPKQVGYADFKAEGQEWRGYARIERDRTVLVAQRLVVREEFAADSALGAIWPIAVLIPLSLMLVAWVVSRILRPLRGFISELQQWERGRTSPLSVEGVPDEILPLVLATNDLVTRLQAQLEFREQFISDAAHELRTPLTALRLQVKNLSSSTTSAEQAGLIAEMTEGVRRMSDLVGKLLQLARADASAPARNPVSVDLSEAIAVSLQDVMPIATEKGIDIGMVASSAQRVLADPDELRTLIGNLIENAVHYTGKGGVIDLSVERTNSEIALEVRDTGPGIPEDVIDQVFTRFVRVPGAEAKGSGLGLPIVRAIADRCGAQVSLVNRTDRTGLIARVVFPAATFPAVQ
jgi:signal transduction histidine kinase